MSESNVNPGGNVGHEINIKRLGARQKDILRFLYRHRDRVFAQVDIIEELHGEVTESRQASVSRAVSRLREHGVAERRQKVLMTPDEHPMIQEPYYRRHRPRFHITDAGEEFVESDGRFPEFGGADDE